MGEEERQESKDQAEPELLYHYTTLDGLLGIIRDGELWATQIQYLNDTSEFEAGPRTAVNQMIEEFGREGESSNAIEKYSPLVALSGRRVYVASFSATENGDDLSQWRAYGGPHSGFSLGFSPNYLKLICEHLVNLEGSALWAGKEIKPLIQCSYYTKDDDNDLAEIRRNIGYFAEYLKIDPLPTEFKFAQYSAGLKDKSFRAEEEWRITLIRKNDTTSDLIRFRRSGSLIVPYVRIPLRWDGQHIEINRMVVGPTPHKEKAKEAAEMLLRSCGVTFKEIVESKVPYRNW